MSAALPVSGCYEPCEARTVPTPGDMLGCPKDLKFKSMALLLP